MLTRDVTKILLKSLDEEIQDIDKMSKKDIFVLSVMKARLHSIREILLSPKLDMRVSGNKDAKRGLYEFRELVKESLKELDEKLSKEK